MTNQKPRDYWIVRHFTGRGVVELLAFEQKPEWVKLQLGDERIHTVEFSAYQEALDMLEELAKTMNHIKVRDVACSPCRMGDYDISEHDSELARKALEKYNAFKARLG